MGHYLLVSFNYSAIACTDNLQSIACTDNLQSIACTDNLQRNGCTHNLQTLVQGRRDYHHFSVTRLGITLVSEILN
jgi:hypothetical protein